MEKLAEFAFISYTDRYVSEVGCEKGRAGSGPIGLRFLANPNPYCPARVKPENPTEFSDAKNPYIIPN
jgi:hypothetical protein